MAFIIEDAVREKAKARVAFDGPSGAGKTHSALLFAEGLAPGGLVVVLDSEQKSSCLEMNKPGIPKFKVCEITKPYSPDRYVEAINQIAGIGADVLIIDGISPEWAGPGGILDTVDRIQVGGQNKMAAWRTMTPKHNAFIDAMLQFPGHLLVTMRSKTEWDMEKKDGGKITPKKLGLAPTQREGIDYEFTVVFDIDQEQHYAISSKDRTSLYDGKPPERITTQHGTLLLNWLQSGAEPAPPVGKPLTAAAKNRIIELAGDAGFKSVEDALDKLSVKPEELTMENVADVAAELKKIVASQAAAE